VTSDCLGRVYAETGRVPSASTAEETWLRWWLGQRLTSLADPTTRPYRYEMGNLIIVASEAKQSRAERGSSARDCFVARCAPRNDIHLSSQKRPKSLARTGSEIALTCGSAPKAAISFGFDIIAINVVRCADLSTNWRRNMMPVGLPIAGSPVSTQLQISGRLKVGPAPEFHPNNQVGESRLSRHAGNEHAAGVSNVRLS